MLLLLSPAKKLDYDSPLPERTHTQPLFTTDAEKLIGILKTKSVEDVGAMMSISASLAELNVQRYAEWQPSFDTDNSRQAVLAFNGDVYEGLDAHSLTAKQLDWAQDHVAILSGLYGVLRPLDLMRPYRLEMGTKLDNPAGGTLYAFWGDRIAKYLNERQADVKQPIVINLASDEYFKAVDKKALNARIVQCVFKEYKDGAYKIVSFYAKRARGLMARYAIEHKAATPKALQGFDVEGYAFAADVSSEDKLVFGSKQA